MSGFIFSRRIACCLPLVFSVLVSGCDNGSSSNSDSDSPVDRSAAPQNVRIPPLAYDDHSVVLVWNKPQQYNDISDYNVYMNGKLLGGTKANHDTYSPAKPYIDNFYQNRDPNQWHSKISLHNFTVQNLTPETTYQFTVRAVHADGTESVESVPLAFTTPTAPQVVNIQNYGAVGDGTTLDTVAIQAAIDNCTIELYPQGCKVLIPPGTFKTGALFLHSDMTLEVAANATLLGSESPADYPLEKGYYLYPYQIPAPLPKRPPSLINALKPNDTGAAPAGTFKNIRIIGQGTIDGNGWVRGIKAGGPENLTDEVGNSLPQYRASNVNKVNTDGILAAAQTAQGIADGLAASTSYSNRRSSLMTLRGVENLYIGELTILNPAYHGIMMLENENITINGIINKTYDANNADGLEFGNSQNAMVFNSFFDTGDDCVNFAAGYGAGVEEYHQPPQSGTWIFNNYFRNGHGAVVAGSHTGAWIENILAEDNVMYLTDVGLRMKSRPYYGGGARNVTFRDNAMSSIGQQPFIFTIKYASDVNDAVPASEPAQFRDVQVQNISIDGGTKNSILVDGMTVADMETAYGFTFPRDAYHQNLHFENVRFNHVIATDISFLHDSQFDNVTYLDTQKAWNFSYIKDILLHDSLNDITLTTQGDEVLTYEAATN
ncbi:exo-poly-alpha-D-galacturonosidase [Serratia sp. S1B]|nr:exo-poly-alpha-D-galacturonosidase [Serratia sp. S1B]